MCVIATFVGDNKLFFFFFLLTSWAGESHYGASNSLCCVMTGFCARSSEP